MMNNNDIVKQYRKEGVVVIPASSRAKMPSVKWKDFKDNIPSDVDFNKWCVDGRFQNIVLVLGDISNNICEIDLDVPDVIDFVKDGSSNLDLKKVRAAVSSQGKVKIYCKSGNTHLNGDEVVSDTAYLKVDGNPGLPHVELKGYGYVSVLPPSLHVDTGMPYVWFNNVKFNELEEIDISKLYHDIVRSLRKKYSYKTPEKRHKIRSCFRKCIDEGVSLTGADGHRFRVALATELVNCHYLEDMIHKELRKVAVNSGENYDFKKTQDFIKHIKTSDYKKYSCKKLKQDFSGFVELYCSSCKTGKKDDDEKKLFKSNYSISDSLFLEEIIKDGKEMFILYNSNTDEWKEIEYYEMGDIKILPFPIPVDARESIFFPSGVLEYDSVSGLRDKILDFALSEYDPGERVAQFKLYATESMNTWLCDRWQRDLAEKFMPILNARGPSETGKKRFLTVFRWLCYHTVYAMATELIPSLARTVAPIDGTLILDEADISRSDEGSEFIRFINSRADGVALPRYNSNTGVTDWIKSFGMTILATRKGYDDDGANSRMQVMLTVKTTKNEIALIPDKNFVKEGQQLQNMLLLFRLRHMNVSMPSKCTITDIPSFRVREALLMLQKLGEEDNRMLEGIQEIAETLNKQIVQDRSLSKEGIMLNAIYEVLCDSNTVLESEGKEEYKTYFIIQQNFKEYNRKEKEYETIEEAPLNCRMVRDMIDRALNNGNIGNLWQGMSQEIRASRRFGKKTFRGILMIKNMKALLDSFPKYVINYEIPIILEDISEKTYHSKLNKELI